MEDPVTIKQPRSKYRRKWGAFFPKMNENISGCKMIETEKLGKNLDNFTNYYKFKVIEWSTRLHKNKKEMMYHSQ